MSEFQKDIEINNSDNQEKKESVDIYRLMDIVDANIDELASDIKEAEEKEDKDLIDYLNEEFDKHTRIKNVLSRYQSQNVTVLEFFSLLHKAEDMQGSKRAEIIRDTPSDEKDETYQKKLKKITDSRNAIIDTLFLIRADQRNPDKNNAKLKESYEKQSNINAQNKESDSKNSQKKIDDIRAELGIENEKAEQELIDETVEKGAITLGASLLPEMKPGKLGGSGYLELKDDKTLSDQPRALSSIGLPTKFTQEQFNNMPHSFGDKGITEVIYLEKPMKEDIYKTETTYVDKEEGGFLGFGKKTVKVPKEEIVVTGQRNISMKKMSKTGNEENCQRLCYSTSAFDTERKLSDAYKEYSHREQYLAFEMLLPESLANKIIEQTRKNPEFFHKLIEAVTIKDIGISKEDWFEGKNNHGAPLRPPYEEWKKIVGEGRMYVMKETEREEVEKKTGLGFSEDCVLKY